MLRFCTLIFAFLVGPAFASKDLTVSYVVSTNDNSLDGVQAAVVGCLFRDDRGAERYYLLPSCDMADLMGPMPEFRGGFAIYLLSGREGPQLKLPDLCLERMAVVHGTVRIPVHGAPRYGITDISLVNIGGMEGRKNICFPPSGR